MIEDVSGLRRGLVLRNSMEGVVVQQEVRPSKRFVPAVVVALGKNREESTW